MKSLGQGLDGEGEASPEYHLFTTFSYNSASKRLTMIPVKYKIKEERRKVLKISVNKLKKIDDPESWLCRSVLINNTMKKLQKETRDEKISKQMAYSRNYVPKTVGSEEFGCLNNNNNNNNKNNNATEKVYRVDASGEEGCFHEKDSNSDGFCKVDKIEGFSFLRDKESETKSPEEDSPDSGSVAEKPNSSMSCGVSINEDFVEKIPSIKRCASRKKSVDEDGTPDEILDLKDSDPAPVRPEPEIPDPEDVDDCDVHDVLSQLYMPPTPRMLTSIDSDTDDDELNVVDIDSSYMDDIKGENPKLPDEGVPEDDSLATGKRRCEDETDGGPAKRRKPDGVFNCFEESYDSFLCGNRCEENERTSGDSRKEPARTELAADEDFIELEDEEDIERRLSQSLSSHYHRKPDKTCDVFFEDNCDNQYSCGHTVTMFNDMQSVTFHNLIASLET